MKRPASVLALFVLFGTTFAVNGEYLIKFSHTAGSATVKGRVADHFAEQANKRLVGKLRVEVYAEGKLYDDAAVIQALRQASGDTGIMAAPDISGLGELGGRLRVFDLPFLFDRIEDVHRILDSPLRGKLFQTLTDRGIMGLTVWDEGMKMFSVRGIRPLRKPPDDFEGRKFGTDGSPVGRATIEALGGTAHELPPSRFLSALSEGQLDGQEGGWSRTYALQLYEVQDWISVSDHAFRGFLVVAGAEFWGGLPDEIRSELTAILDESTKKARELAAQAVDEDRRRIEESGSAIVLGLTSSERDAWRRATADVEKKFAAEIGENLIAEIREFLRRPSPVLPILSDSKEELQPLGDVQSLAEHNRAEPAETLEQSGPSSDAPQ
jgi:C4-dicarboxylate-binding protein DctP